MIYVGIDAAKDKHDCFIVNSDGEVLFDVFTISNTLDGFNDLLFKIKSVSPDLSKTKEGLKPQDITVTICLDFYSTKVSPPMS